MDHGTPEQRALLQQQWSAHHLLGLDPERSVTAARLRVATAEWEAVGDTNVTAARYLKAAHLVAELHGLAVTSSSK
jgi:hypothetical protein